MNRRSFFAKLLLAPSALLALKTMPSKSVPVVPKQQWFWRFDALTIHGGRHFVVLDHEPTVSEQEYLLSTVHDSHKKLGYMVSVGPMTNLPSARITYTIPRYVYLVDQWTLHHDAYHLWNT